MIVTGYVNATEDFRAWGFEHHGKIGKIGFLLETANS